MTMRHLRILLVLALGLLTVAPALAAGNQLAAPLPSAGGGLPAAMGTRCDATNELVCATSAALAKAECGRVNAITVQCTAAGVVGGNGVSPLKLPGSVSWFGDVSCSGDCNSPTFRSDSGGASWPGLLGNNGAGSQSTLGLGTTIRVLFGCMSIATTASADASAEVHTPVVAVRLASVSAPTAIDVAHGSICA
jgi:hypothetical protein